eukprot:Gregarina_sp_Pseudo_9__2609@NODE_286_length_3291_cov_26_004920_g268_i0_p1_GENE_NODE_286_length_3291_cov_26_004920_g268_i0NODE_286_length_3291_cov_26_004920_g268_i0_p1_ORF_typecomplete_len548_score105_24Pkinase/PF00069_25/1e47Pkinase_Tyr/PF07714_17/4e29Kinaselike/PF14531_6/1_1e12Kdo/PF06293_14/2_4e09Pkinase_fungal/PF17667_1/1_4e06RIO1/PF01163_22/1_7e06WaaY/PF06176_11/8_5e06APH/PF01636_23/0_0021Haspin_kinase/PF12330_8/0_47Choline_kinase/PF01633_20/0_018PIP49_C/PF12260_8/0_19EcKinase/PF02958_20/0_2
MLLICGRPKGSASPPSAGHVSLPQLCDKSQSPPPPGTSPCLSWQSHETRADTCSEKDESPASRLETAWRTALAFQPLLESRSASRERRPSPSPLVLDLLHSRLFVHSAPPTGKRRSVTLGNRRHERTLTGASAKVSTQPLLDTLSPRDGDVTPPHNLFRHCRQPTLLVDDPFFRPEPFEAHRFTHPKLVGRAIYGEITVVNDLLLKKKVVIKAVRNDNIVRANHDSRLENPLNEFSIIGYLFSQTCPVDPLFIVKPYALMRDEAKTYLVQEYCPGGELYYKLKHEGTFREDKARVIAIQLIFALLSLHSNFICHRDISLENVLISEDRTIRLIDFGQAERMMDEHNEPKYLTGKAGKSYYRPPEVYYGSYLGAPMDVFSLGVLLYILVTGFPPFEDALPSDCRYRLISSSPDGLHRSLMHEELSMSDDLIDLLSAIFFRPAAHRPTLTEILTHRWLTKDPKSWTVVPRSYPHSELVRRTFFEVNEFLDSHQGQGRRFWRSPAACLVSVEPLLGCPKNDTQQQEKETPRSSLTPTAYLWKPLSRSRLL